MWWKMKKYFKCILQWCRKMQNNILKKYWRSGETSTDMETWQRDYLTGTGWVGTIFWVKRFYNRVIVARCTLRFSRPPLSGWLSTKPPFYAFPRFALFLFKSWLQYNNATLRKWNPSLSIYFMQRNFCISTEIFFQLELLLLAIETKSDTGKSLNVFITSPKCILPMFCKNWVGASSALICTLLEYLQFAGFYSNLFWMYVKVQKAQ